MNHNRYSAEPNQRLPKQQPLPPQQPPQPQQPSQQVPSQQAPSQQPGVQQPGVQQPSPVQPSSTSGLPIGPVITPGAGAIPGESVEFMLGPTGVGIGMTGDDDESSGTDADVGGCRQE